MFKKLNYTEPAVLRGILTAVVSLAAAIGFVNTADIEGAGEALIPALSVLVPLAQSVWTRFSVWSQKAVDDLPGKHAAPEL